MIYCKVLTFHFLKSRNVWRDRIFHTSPFITAWVKAWRWHKQWDSSRCCSKTKACRRVVWENILDRNVLLNVSLGIRRGERLLAFLVQMVLAKLQLFICSPAWSHVMKAQYIWMAWMSLTRLYFRRARMGVGYLPQESAFSGVECRKKYPVCSRDYWAQFGYQRCHVRRATGWVQYWASPENTICKSVWWRAQAFRNS